jgi:hypothetical protein
VYYRREDMLLTGIRAHSRSDLLPKPGALRVAIVVCLILFMLLAVVHVVFAHSADTDADHCPLCIVMHSVVPFLVMIVAVLLVRIEAAASVAPEFRSHVRYWHPILFTRPPPAGC